MTTADTFVCVRVWLACWVLYRAEPGQRARKGSAPTTDACTHTARHQQEASTLVTSHHAPASLSVSVRQIGISCSVVGSEDRAVNPSSLSLEEAADKKPVLREIQPDSQIDSQTRALSFGRVSALAGARQDEFEQDAQFYWHHGGAFGPQCKRSSSSQCAGYERRRTPRARRQYH